MSDNFNFVQAQKFRLSGSGCTSTATSIQITAFTLPDPSDTAITMAMFGDMGFGTLEPGTSREEQISWTGVTANGDGTSTLTGVTRGLRFVAPYDEVSANKLSHAGGTIFVISNTAAFYNELTGKDNDETVTGTWTFTNTAIPRLSSAGTYGASTEEYLATKRYVDSVVAAGAADMSITAKGVAEEATTAEIDAATGAGATSARLAVNPEKLSTSIYNTQLPSSDQKAALAGDLGTPSSTNKYVTQTGLQKGAEIYAADAEASDTYVITLSPVPASYYTGMVIHFKANTANTGAATLNANSLGAKTIKKHNDQDLANNDIESGQIVTVVYDGTNFQMQSQGARAPIITTSQLFAHGQTTRANAAGTGTQAIAHGLGATPGFIRVTVMVVGSGNRNVAQSIGTATTASDEKTEGWGGSGGGGTWAAPYSAQSTSAIVKLYHSDGTDYGTATLTGLDGTNITLDWTTAVSSNFGTAHIHWEAYGLGTSN